MASRKRKLVLSIAIFAAFFILLESGLRIVYFQTKAESSLAILTTIRTAKNWYLRRQAIRNKVSFNIPEDAYNVFWTDVGADIRSRFFSQYAEYFAQLVQEVREINSKMVVLYIPTGVSWDNNLALQHCRPFFRDLAESHGVPFCDLTDSFTSFPIEAVTLMPEDGHMSRFGNILAAEKLGESIRQFDGYQADFHFDRRPPMFGDVTPNMNQIWSYNPALLYRVRANSTGFRGKREVVFPKEKQRILVLGDSQTFGVYLDNKFIYTELLNRKFKDKEFFNAGRAGYGITEEMALFEEKAKYIEPDITVLQVLDNDIFGLFYFKRTEFSRNSEVFEPTQLELDFIKALKN